ncbi:hypothetical protein CSA56_09425 [candidate division KSB3 bacterium]|uniref:FHA domain-containing protein n=1 Tax=candidate division KSB3 bacterium TaxID=2044937 RepID=A0A2G6KGF7_9BACT|nr:MAG: hypothetical protein CSA56_09425 [candidate division KSB3 bacterium]
MIKFLKNSYIQRAIREESRGNYTQAAVYYSKAEEFEKVGEMHELLGDMTREFPAKIRAYQQAIRWYTDRERLKALALKLAQTMELEIRADSKVSTIEKQRLQKVAEYYALAESWNEAGRICEELGMLDQATDMYVQGGHIERIEALAERKEAHAHRTFSAQHYYEEAETTYRRGHRDKAYQALQHCLRIKRNHSKAAALFQSLSDHLRHPTKRIIWMPMEESEYVMFGHPVVTIGRQDDNDLVLTQHDISRHHAKIGLSRHHLLVEDLSSSNGTRINGLKIQRQAEIRDRDVLSIGRHTTFEVRLHIQDKQIAARLCPPKQQELQKYYLFFSGEAHLGSDETQAIPLQQSLVGLPSHLFTIRYQYPFWFLHLHPHLTGVELNGVPVDQYVVLFPGDTVRLEGLTFLIE